MPTLCDYAGIDPPPKQRGYSVKPVIDEPQTKVRDFVVSEAPSNRGRMVRTERFKLVVYYQDQAGLLFDMIEDPGEMKNLYHNPAFADVIDEHKKILVDWESSLDRHKDVQRADAWWYTNS